MNEQNVSMSNDRYKLHTALRGWGDEGQQRLRELTVFVGGTDQPGMPFYAQLALLGVGRIRVGNFGIRGEERTPEDVVRHVQSINPEVAVEVVGERVDDGAREQIGVAPETVDAWLGDAQLIYDTANRIDTKFLLAAAAQRHKVPFIYHGNADLCAYVCPLLPPQTPRFDQLFDLDKLAGISAKVAQVVETAARRGSAGPPTIPAIPSATYGAAALAIGEGLKIVLGVGEPAYNRFILMLSAGGLGLKGTTLPLMRAWMTDAFLELSAAQGFDWKDSWNGRFMQELDILSLRERRT
jgi:molybdopterin/thiamine biosynthesis adenylyltransferase